MQTMPRRGLIIHNPVSGPRDAHPDLMEAKAYLVDRGWSIEYEATRAAGDAGRLAREAAAADLDAALVAGGDGTLNEAVNALVGAESVRTALGVLPCGTANVWARQLGMPRSHRAVLDAARLMDEARVRSIDVGRATVDAGTDRALTRHFLLWSGLGLDAHVTRSIEPRSAFVKRWGVLGYSLAALRAALSYRGARVKIELDDRSMRVRSILFVVSNAELYASYFHLAPAARLDDGWLDVTLFRGRTFLEAIHHFANVLLRRTGRDPRVVMRRAKRIRVTARGHCDVHVDAEPIGATPAEFAVVPQALRALIPATAPSALFVL